MRDFAFDELSELSDATTKLVGFLPCGDAPATNVWHLSLGQFKVAGGLFEVFLLFDAGWAEVTKFSHFALMQTDSGGVHFLQAAFSLTFPEARAFLFQPHEQLAKLAVEHSKAGACFFLEVQDGSCEFSDGIRGGNMC